MCKSFTLLELVIVVVIIAIIAGLGLPQLQKAIYKSQMSEICTTVNAIVKAKQARFLEKGSYESNLTDAQIQCGRTFTPGSTPIEQ